MTTLLNNRYQIIQVLGAGGFGDTFLAEDTYLPSRRRCVIKQLKPVTNDPQMYQLVQQRFQREAATLESLGEGSGQIPKLYAYFSENGQFYLVQEWIQGQTLSHKVEAEGPLSEVAVQEILVSLLPVLDYVHHKGIIHRDIKPDNIILHQVNCQPVLIDFGAVKETMTALLVNDQGKTKHSVVLGTPGFMSPEQATGRSLYASDIYSLGMTAIYLLTAKLPQELELDLKTEQLLWQQYAPQVSPAFAAVIDRAIQYHPRDRYTTAIKMLDAMLAIAPFPRPLAATQATRVISTSDRKAVNHQPSPVTSMQSNPVIAPTVRQGKGQTVILGSLLAGSLLGAVAVFVGLGWNQLPESASINERSPESTSEQTAAKSPPALITPSARATPQPQSKQQPTTQPSAVNQPQSPPEATVPQPTPQATTPAATPAATNPSPTEQDAANNSTASPEPEIPKDSTSDSDRARIPGFPVGTAESNVIAALGSPTKTSRGVWTNTRAVLYDLDPNRVTLGYLFDRNSGRIRQTEVAFAQSVEPAAMQATLREMLGDRAFINVGQGLRQVYQRQTNKYAFDLGELQGVIERNEKDRIYIGVWDADLH